MSLALILPDFLPGAPPTSAPLDHKHPTHLQRSLSRLYYNGILALSFPQSVLRTSPSISSVTGLFFSTFFGGDDTSWATATQQYTYYRNLQLFAGRGQSDTAGPSVSSGGVSVLSGEYGGDAVWLGIAMAVAVALFAAR